jgi:hypothetical protein
MEEKGERLPDEAVVIRFGRLGEKDFSRSVAVEEETTGMPGLSVFSAANHSYGELAFTADLPHALLRCTTVGKLRQLGYDVVPDRGDEMHHCLVTFPSPPSNIDWEQLNGAFDPEVANPARR